MNPLRRIVVGAKLRFLVWRLQAPIEKRKKEEFRAHINDYHTFREHLQWKLSAQSVAKAAALAPQPEGVARSLRSLLEELGIATTT